jgi:hypothetical protein
MYEADRREAGGMGWWTDYPDADINFSIRLSELTKTRVSKQSDGEPNYLVVRLTDEALFNCPWIEMEDVGVMRLSDAEVKRLREYLLKGGFLYVDDFWGEQAWEQWAEEIAASSIRKNTRSWTCRRHIRCSVRCSRSPSCRKSRRSITGCGAAAERRNAVRTARSLTSAVFPTSMAASWFS